MRRRSQGKGMLKKPRKGDVGDEDVDIGDEMPMSSFPPVEIEKDNGHASSSSSSSSDDSSSSSGNNCVGLRLRGGKSDGIGSGVGGLEAFAVCVKR
ncbi:hypothetical protein SADUNF_Sadunf09G0064000 [Salix dunnii]|uniref:Uncharacterized protein n=1 Tax=Salix dunnii TaxID=1413687 RepID=A0A835JQW2_9ROSI|nr:hypothetical protein SADUNF_Sadunf09G0064000 [Salix dunnii]